MEPLTILWKVGIPGLSKYRLGVQGHHFPVSDRNRTGGKARTAITVNGKAKHQMWHNWKELENTKLYSKNFPIRNKKRKGTENIKVGLKDMRD